MKDPNKHFAIRYFRVVDGAQVPYRLVLDQERNRVSDTLDEELHSKFKLVAAGKNPAGAKHIASEVVTEGGLTMVRSANHIRITHADSNAQNMAQFLSLHGENPYPEHGDLRQRLSAELKAAEDAAEEQGISCSSCESGDLKRKYKSLLEARLQA